MDAPPIPRLVDLVHVFKGVVVEQFTKRLEKLLSDSILLWQLLKLLFKILHQINMSTSLSLSELIQLKISEQFITSLASTSNEQWSRTNLVSQNISISKNGVHHFIFICRAREILTSEANKII